MGKIHKRKSAPLQPPFLGRVFFQNYFIKNIPCFDGPWNLKFLNSVTLEERFSKKIIKIDLKNRWIRESENKRKIRFDIESKFLHYSPVFRRTDFKQPFGKKKFDL